MNEQKLADLGKHLKALTQHITILLDLYLLSTGHPETLAKAYDPSSTRNEPQFHCPQ